MNSTEVIYWENGETTFSLPNYPKALHHATGVFIGGSLVVCGGFPETQDCYILKKGGKSFEPLPPMKEKRSGAKSIVVQDQIWITGGHDGNKGLKSTEFLNPFNKNSSIGSVDLPEPVGYHAIINIDDSTSLLIGGWTRTGSRAYSKKTHFFNHTTKTWNNGPALMKGRYHHTAGTIIDPDTNTQHIVVVGGFTDGTWTDSVEILKNGENVWKTGIYVHQFE